jgi:hypothetical protein
VFNSDGYIRVERDGLQWDANEEAFIERKYVSSFDGHESKVFFGPRSEEIARIAFINKDISKGPDFLNQDLRPVLLTYCSQHSKMMEYINLNQFRVTGQVGNIDGHDCVIVDRPNGDIRYAYWLDPSCEFKLRRYLETSRGKVGYQLDVSYDKSEAGWVPSKWKSLMVYPETGKPHTSSEFLVKRHELNLDLSAERFQFEFPPGTRVNDARDGSIYIVRQDGSKRFLSESEAVSGLSPERILELDSSRPRIGVLTLLAGGVLALVGLVVIRFLWRKRISVGNQPNLGGKK